MDDRTQDRFGYEWEKYDSIRPEYREQYRDQFLNWIHPILPDFFKGKRVLDAGCGMGRNSYWPLRWGAQHVTACDHDARSVVSAKRTLKEFSNVTVMQYDLESLPWRDEFDCIFSIGVIHHTRDPYLVMEQLYTALKPGGVILLWVYSKEGFENILGILNFVRVHFTSKLPLGILHIFTYALTVPLYIYLHAVSQLRPYFRQLSAFSFSHLHSILFDQLLPPIARYYSREEARDLLRQFKDVTIEYPPNRNGWIVRGSK